jgi:MFS family permease
LAAPVAVAAWGYIALVGAQFVGRLGGDRLVDRFGQRAVARAGGLIVAGGMGLALAFPSVPGTILGFAAAGLGVATLVPAAMHEADELPGLKPGTGLTVVSWLMRLGFLASPPVVGAVADASSLRLGLLVVPAAGLVVVLAAGVLSRAARPAPSLSP